jgi:hypothetical protein
MNHRSFLLLMAFMTIIAPSVSGQQLGCTDPGATNYDPSATIDDGSCLYFGNPSGCTDPNALNYDPAAIEDDGSCYYPTYGCTDPNATNYDPSATFDDGSCNYIYYGCTDPNAVNYDSNANADDGSCYYIIYGCTNPIADNYNPNASVDDGSCSFSGTFGCTDPNAANYDPWANYDDGSCYYNYYGCMDPNATNYDFNANVDDGSCVYYYDCNGDVNGTADYDDCGDCAGGNTGIIPCVAIGVSDVEVSSSGLNVHPNPSSGRFTITLPRQLDGYTDIVLVDAGGRAVLQRSWDASKGRMLSIDMPLETGSYMLSISTEDGQLRGMVMVTLQ